MSHDLDPPPSVVELVISTKDKDNTRPDSIWKKWLNNLYEWVLENMNQEFRLNHRQLLNADNLSLILLSFSYQFLRVGVPVPQV